jgi:hypothetical protein
MKIQAIWRKRNLKMKVKKMRLDFCLAVSSNLGRSGKAKAF